MYVVRGEIYSVFIVRPTMTRLPASIGDLLLQFGWCHGCFSVPTGAQASNKHVCESYGSKNNFVYPFEASLAPGCHPGFSYAWARAGARARATRARTAHGRALGGTASRALEHEQGPPSSARCPIPVRPPKIVDDLSEKH